MLSENKYLEPELTHSPAVSNFVGENFFVIAGITVFCFILYPPIIKKLLDFSGINSYKRSIDPKEITERRRLKKEKSFENFNSFFNDSHTEDVEKTLLDNWKVFDFRDYLNVHDLENPLLIHYLYFFANNYEHVENILKHCSPDNKDEILYFIEFLIKIKENRIASLKRIILNMPEYSIMIDMLYSILIELIDIQKQKVLQP